MTTAGQRSNEGHGQVRDPIPLFGLLPGSLPSGEVDRLLGDVAAAEDAYQQAGHRGVGRTAAPSASTSTPAPWPSPARRRSGQITSRLVRRVKASQPGSTGSQNVATR
jgi:hypothetical protein